MESIAIGALSLISYLFLNAVVFIPTRDLGWQVQQGT